MNTTAMLQRAKEIANRQGRLANSPGERSRNGQIILCAASCIARAAIEIDSNVMSPKEFYSRVLRYDKKKLVPHIFNAISLDGNRALKLMVENDNRSPNTRLAWFNSLETI